MELIDRFAYLFLGVLLGWLLCLYLQRRPPPLAAVAPKPVYADDNTLYPDFEREGVEKKAVGFNGR